METVFLFLFRVVFVHSSDATSSAAANSCRTELWNSITVLAFVYGAIKASRISVWWFMFSAFHPWLSCSSNSVRPSFLCSRSPSPPHPISRPFPRIYSFLPHTAFVCCLFIWLCRPLYFSHGVSVPLCPLWSGRGALRSSDSAPN